MRSFGWIVAMVGLAAFLAGCVQVKEPLVKFDAGDAGGSRPDTRVKSTDSDEVQALKQRVVELEKQLAGAKQSAEEEKGRRKAADKKVDQLEDQVDELKDQIKDLRKQLSKAYGD
ncbi:MAG: hypothetical protein JXL80_01545 [Planctomycetes bacterium]|nr:hypothetical protein [Planctomycetota bacterium]